MRVIWSILLIDALKRKSDMVYYLQIGLANQSLNKWILGKSLLHNIKEETT